MKILTVWRIIFKRTEKSDWEPGLMIGRYIEDYEKTGNLYDGNGERVEEIIWDYMPNYSKGVVTFIMDQ